MTHVNVGRTIVNGNKKLSHLRNAIIFAVLRCTDSTTLIY